MDHNDTPLCIVGDAGIDLVMGMLDGWPQIGTELLLPKSELRAGGSAANAALAARHLGVPVHLVTATGSDALGEWLAGQFHGIQADLQRCEGDTSISVGLMHTDGERNFFTSGGHLQQLSVAHVLAHLPTVNAPAIALFTAPFLLPGLRCRYEELLLEARNRGFQIALDTGWPPEGWLPQVRQDVLEWLRHCDHLLINEIEACSIAGTDDLDAALPKLTQLLKPGASLVVKVGPRGAIGCEHGQCMQQTPAANDKIFDTIGAGDAFNAGYLAARLRGAHLAASLEAGCNTAQAILPRFPRKEIRAGELAGCVS
jgi:sugar/nucleoside kinase (ribokinase family)